MTTRVGTRVTWGPGGPVVRLAYSVTLRGREPVGVSVEVATEATAAGFGGIRRWFLCPGASANCPCGRRVATLHVPDGATRFCRACLRQTCRSRQESRKWDSLFRRIGAPLGLCPRDVEWALSARL